MGVMRTDRFVKAVQNVISEHIVNKISSGANYSADWRLTSREIVELYDQYSDALCTMNGDTGKVEITARQLVMLLDAYLDVNAELAPNGGEYKLFNEEYG
jgi:hypothetical protein